MRKLLGIVIIALLALSACGDGGGGGGGGGGGDLTAEEQEYVDAALAEFDEEEDAPLTEGDAECIASSMVQAIGTDRLEELGVTPEDFGSDESFPEGLTEDEADDVITGMRGCIDLNEMFLQSLAEDESLTEEAKDCLVDAFDEEAITDLFRTILVEGEEALEQDPDLMSEMLAAFSKCPEALSGLGG